MVTDIDVTSVLWVLFVVCLHLQDTPGWGCTLDPAAYLETLVTVLLKQQEADYEKLVGSRGMDK